MRLIGRGASVPGIVVALAATLLGASAADAQTTQPATEAEDQEITEIEVRAVRVANVRPAGTYASVATALRFDPLTELQSRGLPEGQADVTVRGGLFENTGFRVGAVTIIDPQTGHYVAELPVDPEVLSAPTVLTGIKNALVGFNSNIATVNYTLPRLSEAGAAQVGFGTDALRFGSLRLASVTDNNASRYGILATAALSAGDGSVDDGDHEFARYNFQLQRSTSAGQSDLLLAYQDKFYGWPGAYTGFAFLPETDNTQTTLVLANHRREHAESYWQLGAFYRRLIDDYDFNRSTKESGTPGSFDHETRVYGVGFDGILHGRSLNWHIAGQATADELVRSTDLTNSDFTTRNYLTLSLVPERIVEKAGGKALIFRFGAKADFSNRDSDAVSPVIGASLRQPTTSGSRQASFEYARTSQLPGYTVLGSGISGLFGGNPELGREKADQYLLSLEQQAFTWRATLSVFFRQDDDLVDWTYAGESPFARQANPVDLDVFGIEGFYSRRWSSIDFSVSYTYLDKSADYGSATVDASFYALNFARHRATLALLYRPTDRIDLRIDTEYREQEANPLRSSSDQAFLVAASLAWQADADYGLSLVMTADNLTDDDYQQFPGTPAIGRQISLSARLEW